MLAEVVAEQQRIALVRSAFDPYMDVGGPLPDRLVEERLLPLDRIGRETGHPMIPSGTSDPSPSPLIEGVHDAIRSGCVRRRDLDIDDVLRSQAWDRGGPDVIDPSSIGTQVPTKDVSDPFEVGRPAVIGRDELNHGASLPPKSRGCDLLRAVP